jgi:hypothetical protein
MDNNSSIENQEPTVKKTWMKPTLQEEIAVNTEGGAGRLNVENTNYYS